MLMIRRGDKENIMAEVTLLKDFTKAIVSLEGEEIDVSELGDLPLSVIIDGKVRNFEKLELRKYTFSLPNEKGGVSSQSMFSLVCIPDVPDGEPFLRKEQSPEGIIEKESVDAAQVKLRGFNYEVVKEIFLAN